MVICDTNYFPIVFVLWLDYYSPELFDLFWQFRDEQLADRVEKVVLVHLVDGAEPPSATTRKYLADRSKADPRLAPGNVQFMQVMCVSNPLLRGVLTAVNWMTGKDTFPMAYEPDLPKGIDTAKAILDAAKLPYPKIDSASYILPKRESLKNRDFEKIYS